MDTLMTQEVSQSAIDSEFVYIAAEEIISHKPTAPYYGGLKYTAQWWAHHNSRR